MNRIKLPLKLFLIVTFLIFGMSSRAFASIFGEDSFILGEILSVVSMENQTLGRSLQVAYDNLNTLQDLLGTVQGAFDGIQKPQDFIPWNEGDMSEFGFQRDLRFEKIVQAVNMASNTFNRLSNISVEGIVHGSDLQTLLATVEGAWNLKSVFSNPNKDQQSAVSSLVALESLDSGRRSMALLPDMTDSLEHLESEVNTASPGRSIQLNTNLNFLQTAGLQHLVETQSAATQIAAVQLLNDQEKEKSSIKDTSDVYEALASIVSQELK